jgi:hypothetical protein
MTRQKTLGIALAVAALMGGASLAHAGASECGIVGSWFGQDPATQLRWMGMHTPGTSATSGQIGIEWVLVDPSFGGQFPASQMTAGSGVWEKVKQGSYRYTWFSYGMMQAPPPLPSSMMVPVYLARISGTATMPTCDHKDITYTAEFFSPDMGMLYHTATGTGTEDRMPLTVTP